MAYRGSRGSDGSHGGRVDVRSRCRCVNGGRGDASSGRYRSSRLRDGHNCSSRLRHRLSDGCRRQRIFTLCQIEDLGLLPSVLTVTGTV